MKLELEKKSSRDFIYKQSLAIAAYELPYHPYPVIFFYEKNIDVSRKIFTIRPTFVSFSIFIEQSFPFLSPFFFFFENLHTKLRLFVWKVYFFSNRTTAGAKTRISFRQFGSKFKIVDPLRNNMFMIIECHALLLGKIFSQNLLNWNILQHVYYL